MGSQQNGALVQEGAFSVHLGKMLDCDSTLTALGQGQENREWDFYILLYPRPPTHAIHS